MDIKIENRQSYIYVKARGQFSLDNPLVMEQGSRIFSEVLDQSKKYNITKILLDCRDFIGAYSISDRFATNEFLAEKYISSLFNNGPVLQIAAVLNKTMLTPDRVGDRIANLRGLNLKSTDDMDEACKWLAIENPDRQQ